MGLLGIRFAAGVRRRHEVATCCPKRSFATMFSRRVHAAFVVIAFSTIFAAWTRRLNDQRFDTALSALETNMTTQLAQVPSINFRAVNRGAIDTYDASVSVARFDRSAWPTNLTTRNPFPDRHFDRVAGKLDD